MESMKNKTLTHISYFSLPTLDDLPQLSRLKSIDIGVFDLPNIEINSIWFECSTYDCTKYVKKELTIAEPISQHAFLKHSNCNRKAKS